MVHFDNMGKRNRRFHKSSKESSERLEERIKTLVAHKLNYWNFKDTWSIHARNLLYDWRGFNISNGRFLTT